MTVFKDTFTNIFRYQVILIFCKIPMLLSLIGPILVYPISVKTTGFIPYRQRQLWDLMLKMITELCSYIIVQVLLFLDVDGLFKDYLRIFGLPLHIFHFIIIDSTKIFLVSKMEFRVAR